MFANCDPTKYLELAKSLSISADSEKVRSSADRAYYSAFLLARDQLAAKGYIVPHYTFEDHQYVATNLKQLLGSRGNDENRLRSVRNRLTYDTRQIDNCPSIAWAIYTASSIIESVKALPPKS